MAVLIEVKKPKKYEGAFISIDKKAYLDFCSKTSRKITVVLYTLLAGNQEGFTIYLTEDNVMKVWGIQDKSLANAITRTDARGAYSELRKMNYINEKNEFNELGWGEEKVEEEKNEVEIEKEKQPVKIIIKEKDLSPKEKHDLSELETENIVKRLSDIGF